MHFAIPEDSPQFGLQNSPPSVVDERQFSASQPFNNGQSTHGIQHWGQGIVDQLKSVEMIMDSQFKNLDLRLKGVSTLIGNTKQRV